MDLYTLYKKHSGVLFYVGALVNALDARVHVWEWDPAKDRWHAVCGKHNPDGDTLRTTLGGPSEVLCQSCERGFNTQMATWYEAQSQNGE